MINSCRRIGVILFLCCFAILANSQQATDAVREMFEDAAGVLWIRNMEGFVNDLHPIKVTIGYDGNAYKGTLEILGDISSFDLNGNMDGDVLVLQEIDNNGLHTGYIIGVLEDDRFTGQWWSTDMSRSTDIRLMESGLIQLKNFKPNMSVLEGEIGLQPFNIVIIAETTGVISGTWQRQDECVRLMGQCEDMFCGKIVLVVSEGEMNGTRITLETKDNKSYKVSIENEYDTQVGNAVLVDDISLQYLAQISYSFIIDFMYPVIENGNFNIWVKTKLLEWYNATAQSCSKNDVTKPENRWSQIATCWMDVFLLTDELVSGLITYYNPEKGKYERENFIYSIEEERVLSLTELGKRDVNLLMKLQNEIHQDGVDSNEFIYPVLTKSGFFMCTEFDAIEGDHSAMVSYNAVEKDVKHKAFFTKIEE